MTAEASKTISKYKGLLITSIVLGFLFGGAAAIYPISFIAHLSIPNNESFFSLSEVKRIKSRLPVEAYGLIKREYDPNLKEYLEKHALNPKWIEKNITSTLALTKADTKDTIMNVNSNADALNIQWMSIVTTSYNEELAKRSSYWLAQRICEITFKQALANYIANIRDHSSAGLMWIYNQLPETEKKIDQMQENMKILRDINQKFPEGASDSTRLQLNISAGENKENLSSLSFLTAYLPPIKQLAILETQLAQTLDNKKRLNFERKIIEVEHEAAKRELENLESMPLQEIFDHKSVIYSFWSKVELEKVQQDNVPEWVQNYIVELKNKLRVEEGFLVEHYERQLSEIVLMFSEEYYDKPLLIMIATLVGLLAPGFMHLGLVFLRRLL